MQRAVCSLCVFDQTHVAACACPISKLCQVADWLFIRRDLGLVWLFLCHMKCVSCLCLLPVCLAFFFFFFWSIVPIVVISVPLPTQLLNSSFQCARSPWLISLCKHDGFSLFSGFVANRDRLQRPWVGSQIEPVKGRTMRGWMLWSWELSFGLFKDCFWLLFLCARWPCLKSSRS